MSTASNFKITGVSAPSSVRAGQEFDIRVNYHNATQVLGLAAKHYFRLIDRDNGQELRRAFAVYGAQPCVPTFMLMPRQAMANKNMHLRVEVWGKGAYATAYKLDDSKDFDITLSTARPAPRPWYWPFWMPWRG
jgi:hypothetical protein